MRHRSFCFLFAWLLAAVAVAQNPDSLRKRYAPPARDTSARKVGFKIVPRQITLRSTMLPGWGQASVKQYVAVPIIYAGFGALAYSIRWNNQRYKKFRGAWQEVIDKKFPPPGTTPISDATATIDGRTFPEEGLRFGTGLYRRQRDLSIIGVFGWYALQIVEANVTAHLKTFDKDDDISFHFGSQTDYATTPLGVTVRVNIR